MKEVLKMSKRSGDWTRTENDRIIRDLTNSPGRFGRVLFTVSSEKVRTLKDMKRTAKARYATHDIVGQKSKVEFLGLAPDEITFDVQLNADLGLDVMEEMSTLLDMLRNGESSTLIIGDHAYGQKRWVLESVTFNHEYSDKEGKPLFVTASLTLKEDMNDSDS